MSLLRTFSRREETVRKPSNHHQSQQPAVETTTAIKPNQSKMSSFKINKIHIPFFNNTAKTAPAKENTFITAAQELNQQKKNSLSQRRQTIIHRTDNGRRRNTIWSDTVDLDLVTNLSALELNRQEVLFEIIKTEAEYVRDLRLIEREFIRPIREAEETKYHKSIVPENLNKVFNSISYFLFIHEVISNCLNERQEHQSPLVRSISDILLAYVWVFRAYAPYLIHYEEALRELNECLRKKDKLGRIVKKHQKTASCRNMPLTTYLLKPFQRLLKYPLLIQNLLKCTDREGFDYDNTATLKTKLDTVLKDVEGQKRASDLRALESRIQGLEGFRLAVNNRQLLREVPACQKSLSLASKPSLCRSLTVMSSLSQNPKRLSVRNLYALECDDIVLLAEKTGVNRNGEAMYKLVSRPPTPTDEESVMIHKSEDSGIFCP